MVSHVTFCIPSKAVVSIRHSRPGGTLLPHLRKLRYVISFDFLLKFQLYLFCMCTNNVWDLVGKRKFKRTSSVFYQTNPVGSDFRQLWCCCHLFSNPFVFSKEMYRCQIRLIPHSFRQQKQWQFKIHYNFKKMLCVWTGWHARYLKTSLKWSYLCIHPELESMY